MKFDQFQTSSNNFQQVATTRSNTQHGVQTLATCWAQQCCVLLANNVASVCTGLNENEAQRSEGVAFNREKLIIRNISEISHNVGSRMLELDKFT